MTLHATPIARPCWSHRQATFVAYHIRWILARKLQHLIACSGAAKWLPVAVVVLSALSGIGGVAMKLELTSEERQVLEEVVAERIGEIHPEIRRSVDHEYKDYLRNKLAILEKLLESIQRVSTRQSV